MEIFLAIVGIIISAACMMLVAWVWYTKLFAKTWNAFSGEQYPVRAEGERKRDYAKRMAPRALGQLLLSMFSVAGLIVSSASPMIPLFLVLFFFLPVIGTRALWLKDRTTAQKWALVGIDGGYVLVALYVALGIFTLWGELVLSRLVMM